jgi:hypothetical protein
MAAPWKPAPTRGDYDQPPAGNHPAVLVAMVDLGTQISEYQGKKNKKRMAMCVWELVSEKDTNFPMDDRNFLVGIDLNISNNEAAKFRIWAAARMNKKFPKEYEHDFTQELGKSCLLSVSHNAKGYPKVDGMSAAPRGMTVPPAKTKPFLWSLGDLPSDGSEPDLPDWLPRLYGKKLADVIAECVELNPEADEAATAPEPSDGDGDPANDPF